MGPKPLQLSVYVAFYAALKQYANEDGYLICNVPKVYMESFDRSSSAGQRVTDVLVRMGCLKKHVSKQRRNLAPFCIYQFTEVEPSEELYDLYVVQPHLEKNKPAKS